jgi:hypothetical protein
MLVQHLMLREAAGEPDMVRSGTDEALDRLRSGPILSSENCAVLSGALSLYRDLMQVTRAACVSGPLPASMSIALMSDLPGLLGEADLASIEARLGWAQAQVRTLIDRMTAA